MLNLKELEAKLDLALEKETEESLTSWLLKKRIASYFESLGSGEFEEKEFISCTSFTFINDINETNNDALKAPKVETALFLPTFPIAA